MVVDKESVNAEMGDEEEEDSMKKERAKFDLPPGRQEHQNLIEHTIRLANKNRIEGAF